MSSKNKQRARQNKKLDHQTPLGYVYNRKLTDTTKQKTARTRNEQNINKQR